MFGIKLDINHESGVGCVCGGVRCRRIIYQQIPLIKVWATEKLVS